MTNPNDKQIPVSTSSLRRRALSSLAVQLYRHAFLASIVLIGLTAGAGWRLAHLNFNEDLRADIQRDSDDLQAWQSIALAAPTQEPVFVILRFTGEQPPAAQRRNALSESFREALDTQGFLNAVEEIPPRTEAPTSSDADLLILLRPNDIAAIKTLESAEITSQLFKEKLDSIQEKPVESESEIKDLSADDPLGLLDQVASRQRPRAGPVAPAIGGMTPVKPTADTVVLRLAPRLPATKLFHSLRLKQLLDRTTEAMRQYGEVDMQDVEVEFRGRHIRTARIVSDLTRQLQVALVILGLCVILLMILAFRKAEAVAFIALPPLFGLVWTYALTTWIAPDLDLLVAVMPLFILSLGAEFSLQIYHRFIQELYRTGRYYPALSTAYIEAGRGILVAMFVSGGVFVFLALSPIALLRQFSLVSATATLMMALSALLILPPMAAIKSRLAGNRVSPVDTFGFGMRPISAAVTASPRAVLTVALIVTVYLAYFSQDIRLDRESGLDLTRPAGMTNSLGGNNQRQALPVSFLVEGRPGAPLQEVLGENDRLYQNLLDLPESMPLDSIASLSAVLPSRTLQEKTRLDIERLDVQKIQETLSKAAREAGLDAQYFAPFIDRLLKLKKSTETTQPIDIQSANDERIAELARKHIVHDNDTYRIITVVVPETRSIGVFTHRFNEFYHEVVQGSFARPVRVNSEAVQNRRVSRNVIWAMALTVMLSVGWVTICMALHFRGKIMDTMLALLPMGIAAIWAMGTLIYFEIRIGLYALLIYPLALGISTLQATLLMQRINERSYASMRQAFRVAGRSNIIGASMHLLALGCLAQVDFYALREMSFMALVAILAGTFTTMMFIPSILEIRRQGGLSAWSPLEE